jgi:hypothetical protein
MTDVFAQTIVAESHTPSRGKYPPQATFITYLVNTFQDPIYQYTALYEALFWKLLGKLGLIPQSLQLQVQVNLANLGWFHKSRESARIRVRLGRCVPVVRAAEVPVFFCLRNSCDHVTDVGEP